MNKILVVYYSRSGHTKQVAREIASMCGADIEAIRSKGKSDMGFGFLRALFSTGTQRVSPIEANDKTPDNYDLVIIGTPVWMSKLSSFVNSYLKRHAGKFKQVAFFCTEGGSGDDKVFKQISDLLALTPEATLTVTERELAEQSYLAKLRDFSKKLTGNTLVLA